MRIALVGFGRMGEARAEFYRRLDGVRVIGIVDPTVVRRERAAYLVPGARVVRSLGEIAMDADAVDICSPPVYHAPQTHEALVARRHVICEKPAVLDPAIGLELLQHANYARRVLYPCHNYLYSPLMRTMLDVIGSNEIGRVRRVLMRVDRPSAAAGTLDWRPSWRLDHSISGGGILTDHGTHCIYMALRLAGSEPLAVACELDVPNGPGVEFKAALHLRFSQRIDADIELSWVEDGRRNGYLIFGERGCLVILGDTGRLITTFGITDVPGLEVGDEHTHSSWFGDLFADFRQATLSGSQSYSSNWGEAITVAHVLATAYKSARLGGVWLRL
jgi:predicted dehydrogenase